MKFAEVFAAMDESLTQSARKWLMEWTSKYSRLLLQLPAAEAKAVLAEQETFYFENGQMKGSETFLRALKRLDAGDSVVMATGVRSDLMRHLKPLFSLPSPL